MVMRQELVVGQVLDAKQPHLKVEEILTCKDGRLVLRVRPVYKSEVLNKSSESSVSFASDLEDEGWIEKDKYVVQVPVLCTPSAPSDWHGEDKQMALAGEPCYYGQGCVSWGPYTAASAPKEAWECNDLVASGEWVPVEE